MAQLQRRCLPELWDVVGAIPDPRDTEECTYTVSQLVGSAMLMFCCRAASRRQWDRMTEHDLLRQNWCALTGARTDTAAVYGTVRYLVGQVEPAAFMALQPQLVRGLIRRKQLPGAHVLGRLMVAADGTGIYAETGMDGPHCPHCLEQHHENGSVTYMHQMLDARVISTYGMAIPLMSEAIENRADGQYEKQDCELKAFHRLLERVKTEMPRQPILWLFDSLYACEKVLDRCGRAPWDFICVFKRGSIPTLFDDAYELLKLEPHNRLVLTTKHPDITCTYRWLDNLEYGGQRLSFVETTETDKDGNTGTWVWLTSLTVNRDNVIEIAQAGRLRWKTENEGNNEQKTGYGIEHFCNCSDYNEMMALYFILQIAMTLMWLLARSNLLDEVPVLTHLAFLLLESLRNTPIDLAQCDPHKHPYQVRFTKPPP